MSDDFVKIIETKDWILKEFANLGWYLDFEKRNLVPSHETKSIGYILKIQEEKDSVRLTIPKERINTLKKEICRILKKGHATARGLAKVTGQCVSMTKAVLPAKLLLRNIYRCLAKKSSWQDTLNIDSVAIGPE